MDCTTRKTVENLLIFSEWFLIPCGEAKQMHRPELLLPIQSNTPPSFHPNDIFNPLTMVGFYPII